MKHRLLAFLMSMALLSGCARGTLPTDPQLDLVAQAQNAQVSQPQTASSAPEEPIEEVRLAYNPSDSLNPYKMKTQLNRELTSLLYDGLTRPDKTYQPQNVLATEIVMEGKLCTVKFNRKAQFTDGTLLTGKDILYSITTAASSETNWRTTLQNVAGCSVNGDGDVEIHLYAADADFPVLLSFPIIKEGTATLDFPTGVSKFFMSGTWENGVVLSQNPLYYGKTGGITRILLTQVRDPNALNFSLKTGSVDVVYSDLSAAEFINVSSSNVPVAQNNLVYLGMNSNKGLLTRAEFRQALSEAVNRDELVSKAYVSRARATLYPMNPDFYRMQGMELSTPRRLSKTEELMDGLGLTRKNDDGYRVDGAGRPLTLSLLVNSENAYRNAAATLLAEQLGQAGIKVNVVSKSFTQYQQDLNNLNFDLYIGETRLMDNMDFSVLLNGGALGYGTAHSEELTAAYRTYRGTGSGVEPLCSLFSQQSPFIPLVFRQGMVCFDRTFRAEIVATEQDIFYNIMDW